MRARSAQGGVGMLQVALEAGDQLLRPVLHFARSESHGRGPINTWHCHDVYHVVYIVEGEGLFRLDDLNLRAEPGLLFLINPGQWHQFISLSETFSYDAITFEFQSVDGTPCTWPLWRLFAPAHQEVMRQAFADGPLSVPDRLKPWVRTAFGAAMPPGHGSGESTFLYHPAGREGLVVVTFLQDLGEIIQRALPGAEEPPSPLEGGFQRRLVDQAVRFMNENFTRPLTLDDIARHFHIHPVYFSQLFKAEIGLPPRQYLLRLRLSHARRLLGQTDLAIRDVAVASGFRNVAYFSRAFRAAQGMSPSEYRTQYSTANGKAVSPV